MNENMLAKTHPFLLFWVGVLTGAIVVALVFMYRQGGQVQSSVLSYPQGMQQFQRTGPNGLGGTGGKTPVQMKTGSPAVPSPQPAVPSPQPLQGY